MGSFTGCNKLEAEGHANYTMINVYMTTVPSEVKMGFCIPSDCNENSLSRVQTMIYYYLQPHCATIFSSGIFDAQKQLNETDVEPECFVEIELQSYELLQLQKENQTGMEISVSLWLIYTSFIVFVTFYDLLNQAF
jgi:hypothetical protein